MASSNDKFASFRWELKDFRNQLNNNANNEIISGNFNMGSVSFALFYNTTYDNYRGKDWSKDSYGIVLKNIGNKQLVEFSLKLWFENEHHHKFYENSIGKYLFNKVGDRCKINVKDSGNDWTLFCNSKDQYYNNRTLCIYCEVTDLDNRIIVPVIDRTQEFYQNTWSMFEQEKYDAVIKVGETEFKVLKAFFMAQSEVFDEMFSSAFKEGKTSIVEVKDFSEKTIKQLIKWLYTCRIDDKSVVEELFEVADKYAIKLLKATCVEIMINSFDNSNAFRRLILAVAHEENQLKDVAFKQIDRMPKNEAMIYFVSPEWNDFIQKKPSVADVVKKEIAEKLKK